MFLSIKKIKSKFQTILQSFFKEPDTPSEIFDTYVTLVPIIIMILLPLLLISAIHYLIKRYIK